MGVSAKAALTPATPTITSPTAGKVSGDTIDIRGTAPNAQRVEITVLYRTSLLGILGSSGTISQTTVEVDKNGNFASTGVNIRLTLGGTDTEYTINVVGIGEDGTRSETATVKLTR